MPHALADGLFSHELATSIAALAAVAVLGFLIGRRRNRAAHAPAAEQLRVELARVQQMADGLRRIGASVAVELNVHSRSVTGFQKQIASMESGAAGGDWSQLRESADQLLGPTLTLATSLTVAGDQLRRQHAQLSAFSGSRVDHGTGLHNRRALDEQLEAFFSIHAAGKRRFALAAFSASPAADEGSSADERLRQVARLLEECIREDDFVARYSDDEFVVLMPQTSLSGALAFSERLLVRAVGSLGGMLWGGVVEATKDENADKLLSRADSALYSARATGQPALFHHTGHAVRRHAVELPSWATSDPLQHELAPA